MRRFNLLASPDFFRRQAFICALMMMLMAGAGCAPAAPTPDRPPHTDATPTPLPTPEKWTRATSPIRLDNIAQVRDLGVLTVPEPPSTIFAYALTLDNTRLYGLNNDHLLGWDLLTGALLFNVPREEATSVFVSPDRRRVYTVSGGAVIRVYTSDTGAPVENFRALDTYQRGIAYDPLSGLLALGGIDGRVQLWDVPARTALGLLRGASDSIIALTFSPDGQSLLAADESGALTAWDTVSLELQTAGNAGRVVTQLLYTANGLNILADTPDGTLRLSGVDLSITGGLAEGASNGIFGVIPDTPILMHGNASGLSLWNIETGVLAANLEDTAAERLSAAASPDGTLLMLTLLGEGISIWNLTDVEQGTVLRGALRLEDPTLREVLWTPDGYQILLFTTRGPIRVLGVGG